MGEHYSYELWLKGLLNFRTRLDFKQLLYYIFDTYYIMPNINIKFDNTPVLYRKNNYLIKTI